MCTPACVYIYINSVQTCWSLCQVLTFAQTPPSSAVRTPDLTFTGDSLALQTNQQGTAQIALVGRLERLDDEVVWPLWRAWGVGGVGRWWGHLPHGTGAGFAWTPRLVVHRLVRLHELPCQGGFRGVACTEVGARVCVGVCSRRCVLTVFIPLTVNGELLKRERQCWLALLDKELIFTQNMCTVPTILHIPTIKMHRRWANVRTYWLFWKYTILWWIADVFMDSVTYRTTEVFMYSVNQLMSDPVIHSVHS